MHKLTLVAPIAALALLPTAAGAERPAVQAHARRLTRTIVINKSIGGLKLGLTPSQLEHRLGKPSHTIRVSGKIAELQFSRVGIDADFDTLHRGDPANLLAAFQGRFHTTRGIHPGSTVAALKRAYRHDKLRHEDGLYTLFKGTPGSTGSFRTDFGSAEGKIVDIDIQTVFNDE